jgi:hypothetical protein
MVDITEVKKADREIQKLSAELTRVNAELIAGGRRTEESGKAA